MRLVLALALLPAALAGGCRQSDEAIKTEMRAQMMQRCTTDIASQAAGLPGLDTQRFCTCVTDKALGQRSVAELKTLFDDKATTAAQGRQAATECLSQQMPNGIPAQAAAVPDAAAQAKAQPAPAPAPTAEAPADAGADEAAEEAAAEESAEDGE